MDGSPIASRSDAGAGEEPGRVRGRLTDESDWTFFTISFSGIANAYLDNCTEQDGTRKTVKSAV